MTLYGIYKTNHNYLLPDLALNCFIFGVICLYAVVAIIVLFLRKCSSSTDVRCNMSTFRRRTQHGSVYTNLYHVDSADARSSGLDPLGKSQNVQVPEAATLP